MVIALCNGAHTILATLDSVARQSLRCVREIVVVDDASEDDSVRIVRSYGDERIRVVQLPSRGGVSNARNAGVQAAGCEWIAFNDADDVWLPDKLEQQFRLLRAFPEAIGCVGGNGRLHRDQVSQWRFKVGPFVWQPEDGPQPLDPPRFRPHFDGHAYIQSLLVKRRFASQVAFKPELNLMQDQDFLLRLAQLGPLVCVGAPVFLYRLGYSNTTAPGRMRAHEFLANRAYLDAMANAVKADEPHPIAKDFLTEYTPDPRDIRAFEISQRFRLCTTTWVNRGLLPALLSLAVTLIKSPADTLHFIWARFSRR